MALMVKCPLHKPENPSTLEAEAETQTHWSASLEHPVNKMLALTIEPTIKKQGMVEEHFPQSIECVQPVRQCCPQQLSFMWSSKWK